MGEQDWEVVLEVLDYRNEPDCDQDAAAEGCVLMQIDMHDRNQPDSPWLRAFVAMPELQAAFAKAGMSLTL